MLPEDEPNSDDLAKENQEYYDETDENGEFSDNEGNYEVDDQDQDLDPRSDNSFRDRRQ